MMSSRHAPLAFASRLVRSQAKTSFRSKATVPTPAVDSATLSGESTVITTPLSEPLSVPFRELDKTAKERGTDSHTQITQLPNGVRVASDSAPAGEFCTVGLLFNAGSRYEAAYPSGVSHFIEKLAYGSSANYSSRESIFSELELHGGITDCQSTKDTFIYASSCHHTGLDPVMKILSDSAWRPVFTDEELTTAKEVIQFDIEDMNRNPNPEQLLTDWIHAAAYRSNTLGLPKYCPLENVGKIGRPELFSFMRTYFAPDRLVVAGVGVSHTSLVDCAAKYLSGTAISSVEKGVSLVDESVAQFTGGQVAVVKDLSSVALGPTPMPELAHFSLGMESCSYRDSDFVPFCVLNSLMGGGGSFSAGGPGKGMYTRLYLNVLNRHHWIYGATAYNHVYADSGLFCIHASSDPRRLSDLVSVITEEFINMTGNIQKDELSRAKTQLKSTLLMNLEQRPVMFEDLGRQVLGHGFRKSPTDYMESIEKVQSADILRVANRLLSGKVAVVGYGNLDNLPAHNLVEKAILSRDLRCLRSKGKFFASA